MMKQIELIDCLHFYHRAKMQVTFPDGKVVVLNEWNIFSTGQLFCPDGGSDYNGDIEIDVIKDKNISIIPMLHPPYSVPENIEKQLQSCIIGVSTLTAYYYILCAKYSIDVFNLIDRGLSIEIPWEK